MRPALAAGAVLVALLTSGRTMAQDASRWTGSYAGGDIGTSSDRLSGYVGTPCHVACGGNVGAHAGYGTNLGSGFVGGIEGDGALNR